MTEIAVVTIAHGRREHLRHQAASLGRQHRLPDRYVIVDLGGGDPWTALGEHEQLRSRTTVVDLPMVVDHLDLASARNTGWAAAGAAHVVFLDVDCLAHPDLVAEYDRLLTAWPDALHAGPVGYLADGASPPIDLAQWEAARMTATYHDGRPVPAQPPAAVDRYEMFWSLSFALTDTTWRRIGGFDEGYVGYGGEDTDFAFRARAAGVGLMFDGTAEALHQFHPSTNPPTGHLASICRNATRFHDTWGAWPMTGWLAAFTDRGLIDWHEDAERIVVHGPSAPTVAGSAPPEAGTRPS